jgi:uncharacterized protein (DUF952 family)
LTRIYKILAAEEWRAALAADRGEARRWEPSRGGDLFPHLYASLEPALVRAARDAPLDDAGVPDLGRLD